MHLLSSPASPFARKCRVVLIETAQTDVTVRGVHASPAGSDDTLRAANPVGKIPVLIRDDAPALFDSRVICRFLDDRAKGGLYPPGGWDVLTLEAGADAVMEAALLMVYERRLRPDDMVFEPWLDAQWGRVERTLDSWDARAMPILQGRTSIASIAVGCALGYLDFRLGDRDWRGARPALAAWEAAFAMRDAMAETRPA
ncbi:glutathione S-transferase family protein [Jannaschia sp. LMIT008]|uniref:glutathione S-transferase family protein n=1 Tax=Jannaschia maritima TaxID=3032585 RepID=UPI002810CF7A|nr:glutathione S-transferase family protein [Jannaschia sp. LMIT008]